ncbi:hypothetical protein BSLA_02f0665 [Burkholderia stabilis]|nr:hypothetical protein BSLA_02f0665 [Burkholderia stabilis]
MERAGRGGPCMAFGDIPVRGGRRGLCFAGSESHVDERDLAWIVSPI